MSNPKVSVIIPVYNTAAFLDETICSITSQTLKEIEIITIDDGSTDGSYEILKKISLSDDRIKIIQEENSGQSVARNAGIESATGKYLYFMDSDDLLETDALEKCFEKCEKDELDLLLFDGISFGNEEYLKYPWFDYRRVSSLEDKIYDGRDLLEFLISLNKYRCSICLHLINHSFLNNTAIRFCPGIIHEDELFMAQLYLLAGRVGKIDRVFFKRRLRPDSIMTSPFTSKNLNGYLTVVRKVKRFASDRDKRTRDAAKAFNRYTLNGFIPNAAFLPLNERVKAFNIAIFEFPFSVKPKNLIKLLLKKALKRRD